ncbi:MAG: septum formation initiator family protein [Patescibacteria group bacterium]
MRKAIISILVVLLLALLTQIYFTFKERNQLKSKLQTLTAKAQILSEENSEIKSEIEYFKQPKNLEKELRSKLNYKKPGEKMFIITQ